MRMTGNDQPHRSQMSHHYKGHTIQLVPSAEGLMWACQYVIMKHNETEIAGFPDGNTYDTRTDAEAAALAKAKAMIDECAVTKDPLGSGY
jgi:hypothetical protein